MSKTVRTLPSHRRPVAALALWTLALAAGLPQPAGAQAVPKAGSTTLEPAPPLRPPVSAPVTPASPAGSPAETPGPSFVLRRVRFVGATVFSDAELQTLAAAQLGKAVTLADLEAIAQRAAERYRAAGYLLAQALVPAQDVTSGDVEISLLEGRLGRVQIEVDPAAPIGEAQVRAIVNRLPAGKPLQQTLLNRVLLLLSDLPGVRAEAALEIGEAAGSTDLIVNVSPSRRWDLAFDADNHGSRSTAEYRVGLQGRWNSPLRAGDNLDYRLQLGSGGHLSFGRVGYERPLGGDGLRFGVAASTLEYALGGDFAALDASGRADVVEAGLTYALTRSRTRNLFAKLLLQRKLLEDRFGAAIGTSRNKRMSGASFALSYENSDTLLGGGYTSAGVTLLAGELDLDAEGRANDARRTAGGFSHINYNLSRLHAIGPKTHLYLGLAGQIADKNLDSVEKVSLGGPRGVRAYAPSEITADEGHILNAELRYSPTPELSLQGFYDWGWARRNKLPDPALDTDNKVRLRGFGVGAFWGAQDGFTLRASLAWRDSRVGEIDQRNPRLYLQLSKPL